MRLKVIKKTLVSLWINTSWFKIQLIEHRFFPFFNWLISTSPRTSPTWHWWRRAVAPMRRLSALNVSRTDWKALNGGVKLQVRRVGHYTWLLRLRGCSVRPEKPARRRTRGAAEAARRNQAPQTQPGWKTPTQSVSFFSNNCFQIHYYPFLKHSQCSSFMIRSIKYYTKIIYK